MTGKNLRKAAVSLIINSRQSAAAEDQWPPVVVSGPEETDPRECFLEGKQLIDLLYDGLRVVGTLVEESGRKVIRVEIFEVGGHARPCADTGGEPTLK